MKADKVSCSARCQYLHTQKCPRRELAARCKSYRLNRIHGCACFAAIADGNVGRNDSSQKGYHFEFQLPAVLWLARPGEYAAESQPKNATAGKKMTLVLMNPGENTTLVLLIPSEVDRETGNIMGPVGHDEPGQRVENA